MAHIDDIKKHLQNTKEDIVNHPSHYQGSIECIEAIEASMTPESFRGYLRGNAIKYLWRSGRKGSRVDWITDLKKTVWYINKFIESLEKECQQKSRLNLDNIKLDLEVKAD